MRSRIETTFHPVSLETNESDGSNGIVHRSRRGESRSEIPIFPRWMGSGWEGRGWTDRPARVSSADRNATWNRVALAPRS